MWTKILLDALLAAIAAIGFSAISRPPLRVIPVCALIAAIGHALRFWLMNDSFGAGLHIIAATLIAALTIGVLCGVSVAAHFHSGRDLPLPFAPAHDSGHICLQDIRRSGYVCT